MKQQLLFTAVIGVGCLLGQSTHATLLMSESFNYTSPGILGGNVNPSTGSTWTGANPNFSIVTPDLTYTGLADQGGNALQVANGVASSSINTFANVTSGQIYYSFLLDITALPTGNSYLTALNPGTTSPGGGTDALDLYVVSTGALEMRTGSAFSSATSVLSLNTTYLVVLEYDFGATLGSLYLDPASSSFGGSAPTATETKAPTTAPTAIDDVGFKSQSAAGANYIVDNLLVGTTWADVTPVSAVPEPSTLALVGLGLTGLAARLRRGRR